MKGKTVKPSDLLTFNKNRAIIFYRGNQIFRFLQSSTQMRGTFIHKSFGQPAMQAI